MTTHVTLRANKGSSLSWQEMDNNFSSLLGPIVLYTDLNGLVFDSGADVTCNSYFQIASTGGINDISVGQGSVTLPAGSYVMEMPNLTTESTYYTSWCLYNVTDVTSIATYTSPVSIFTGTRYTWQSTVIPFSIDGTKTLDFRKIGGLGTAMQIRSYVGSLNLASGNASMIIKIYKV